jgi:hypothetical protein
MVRNDQFSLKTKSTVPIQYFLVSTASTMRAWGFIMIVPSTRPHTTRIAASKASA